jgi:oxygen-independent coproporphyrinogen-3 oxidase
MAYWQGRDFIGFGPSAFSTVGLRRWQNIPDTASYTARMLSGESCVSFEEALTAETRRAEIAAFGIRMANGVASETLAGWSEPLAEFHELGFLKEHAGRTILTRRGKLMADAVRLRRFRRHDP